jgi:hypothetical protein
MSEPRKVKVLTRLRIDEVSAVDAGAGKGVKIMLMKRADGADDPVELSVQERARAKMEGRAALRDAEDIERRKREGGDENRNLYFNLLTGRVTTAELYGGVDKSLRRDEDTPADELVGGNDHPASKIADLLVESGKHPDRQSALDHLLHNPRGAAMLRRLSKSEDSPMPINLSDVVKNHGVIALAKFMCEQNSSFGATEHELVALATEDAQRKHPDATPAGAFAKLFMESVELREAIEIAKGAALQDDVAEELERDSRKACEELSAIGKARWPSLSPAQRFARAAETNPQILKRAHRRPGPSTSFPHPTSKAMSLEPRVTSGGMNSFLDVDADAPAAYQELMKLVQQQRREGETEAAAFERVFLDPANKTLALKALGQRAPTESSPPRQS